MRALKAANKRNRTGTSNTHNKPHETHVIVCPQLRTGAGNPEHRGEELLLRENRRQVHIARNLQQSTTEHVTVHLQLFLQVHVLSISLNYIVEAINVWHQYNDSVTFEL